MSDFRYMARILSLKIRECRVSIMKTAHLISSVLALIVVVAIAPRSIAQERHGTIAVVLYDVKRLIIAADSRNNFGKGLGASQNDLSCKIAALGKYSVFVASGLIGYDNAGPRDQLETWRATDEARRVYARLVKKHGEWQDEYIDEFARSWGEVVQSRIADLASFAPLTVHMAAVDGLLTTALTATGHGKNIQVILIQIGNKDGKIQVTTLHRIGPEVCPPCALGRGEIVTEFVELKTERARIEAQRLSRETIGLSDDEREIRRIIRLVDLTIRLLPENTDVGGPIDALELHAGEPLRWIQRKSECPE
jgi:hypothetical protein